MCGIFGYLRLKGKGTSEKCDYTQEKCQDCSQSQTLKDVTPQMLYEAFEKIRPRGPDRSTFHEISEYDQMMYLGFQRLAIMDPTTDGDQPFNLEHKRYNESGELVEHRSIYVICNGEIYNHHDLIEKYGYAEKMRGRSDCEFLPHFYAEHGIKKYSDEIRGEFACAILDIDRSNRLITIYLVRDTSSTRPLYIGMDDRGFGFASLPEGLYGIIDETKIHQLRGGIIYKVKIDVDAQEEVTFSEDVFFDLNVYMKEVTDTEIEYKYEVTDMLKHIYPDLSESDRLRELNTILTDLRETFERCVISTLESDVPLGALLSGGLDSSLVVAIAAKHLRKTGKRMRTFSIGIQGATDKEYAEAVALEAGTDHTHVEFSQDDFLNAVTLVIKAIGSYDLTTVRASDPQWLISKWIRENTDIKVLMNGDFSDEENFGYLTFYDSPSPITSHNESVRLLRDIHYFDALRSDRGIASNGLEARTPFAHRDLIEHVVQIDPRLKVPLSDTGLIGGKCSKRMEKWLLRKAFDVEYKDFDGKTRPYLPAKVVSRRKEAFSDGISSKEKSWYEVIQESLEELYTQEDIDRWVETLAKSDTKCSPWTKEAVHYLEIFTQHFGKSYQMIPYYWMPSFSKDAKDPSARVLDVYNQ